MPGRRGPAAPARCVRGNTPDDRPASAAPGLATHRAIFLVICGRRAPDTPAQPGTPGTGTRETSASPAWRQVPSWGQHGEAPVTEILGQRAQKQHLAPVKVVVWIAHPDPGSEFLEGIPLHQIR